MDRMFAVCGKTGLRLPTPRERENLSHANAMNSLGGIKIAHPIRPWRSPIAILRSG